MRTGREEDVDYTATVAKNIREALARTRYRVTDMAAVIGKTRNSARAKYRGTTRITVDELGAISEWLNIPVADFFTN